MRTSGKWLAFLVTVLCMVWSGMGFAQSREQNPDRRIINATMDPVLEGDWAGRSNQPGMSRDPLAIACMVRRCAAIRAAYPNDKAQWRNSRNFAQCYTEHASRVRRADFIPLANPPMLTVLSCGLIEAQRHSADDRVYEAVNGHARPVPPPAVSAPAVPAPVRTQITDVDMQEFAAMSASASAMAPPRPAPSASASATSMPDDNPYKDEPPARKFAAPAKRTPPPSPAAKPANDDNPYGESPSAPVATGTGPGDLGDKLVLKYANQTSAAIYVKAGGQFYTVRASWLAKTYETDWESVYSDQDAKAVQYFGACFEGGKVSLDGERMQMRPYDMRFQVTHPNQAFKDECKQRGGEFRFALQAGQTIVLKAKAASSEVKTDNASNMDADGIALPATNPDPPAASGPATTASDAASAPTVEPGAPPPPPATTATQTPATNPNPPAADSGTSSTGADDEAKRLDDADNPLGEAFGHDRTPRFAKFSGSDSTETPGSTSALPETREGIFADQGSATGAGEAPSARSLESDVAATRGPGRMGDPARGPPP